MDLIARINERKTQSLLQSFGCNVLRSTRRNNRAVIEIATPTPALQAHASSFTEMVNGQRRSAYVVYVNNCLVHWHSEASA